jgi:glycosyltransferase 2 family protein
MSWKMIRKWLPFVGLALFVYLLIKLDITEIFKQISEMRAFYLIIALPLVLLFLIFQTLKWYVLARKQKIPVAFWKSFKINLISDFYGLVTPGKLGAVMRADYLKKYATVGKGLSNFVIDKVLDLSSLFFLAIVLGFFVLRGKLDIMMLNFMTMLFLILILCFISFYDKKRSQFFLKIAYRKFMPKKMKTKAKAAFDSFYEDLPKKSSLVSVFLVNLCAWIVNYTVVYFIALSLGIEIKFIYFLAIYPVGTLIAQIPITISGLGTREAALIGLFGLFGVGAVKVFSMSIIGLFIMAVFPSLIIIPFILKERNKNEVHKIKKSRREDREGSGNSEKSNRG